MLPTSRISARVAVVPPLIEPSANLFLAQQALLQADLEQEGQRLADERAGTEAQLRHHLRPIELRSDRGELLTLGELGDASLELIHASRQHQGLALVAGRAV